MGDVATKQDVWEARNSLREEMRTGFERITEQLDTLNGRVGKGEVEQGKHDVRLIGLERRVYSRRRTDSSEDQESGDDRRLTQRDARLILAAIVGTIAVLGFFLKVLPAALKTLGP